MPVRKYRSVAEMPRLPVESATPLELRIAAVWERAHLRGRRAMPRGVQRFESHEQANEARKRWNREHPLAEP